MYLSNNEKGQSLIEVLVVGVVSAIMIIALIIIILSSLKNAQFAQNQTQATKLAQDTIDKIRILRDNNAFDSLTSATVSQCFIELWNNTPGNEFVCDDTSANPGDPVCYYRLVNDTVLDKVDYLSSNVLTTGIFYRRIIVRQNSSEEAKITVVVSWLDSSGEHSSMLETIITKPNYDCVQT